MRHLDRFLVVSVLAVAAAWTDVAFGDENLDSFVSTKSREEVRAEWQAFKASGVNPWSAAYNPLASFQSTKTRDEVQAEFLASRKEVEAFTGEDSGSAYLSATPPVNASTEAANDVAATK
jgi:hypothetical protein